MKLFYVFCCFLKLFITSSDCVPFPSLNTSRIISPSTLYIPPVSFIWYEIFMCMMKMKESRKHIVHIAPYLPYTHLYVHEPTTPKKKRRKIVIKEDIDIHSRSIHFSIIAALVVLWVPLQILLFSSRHPFHFHLFHRIIAWGIFIHWVLWRETKYNGKESESASCDNNANNLF